MHPNYAFRSSVVLVLLFVPVLISRFGRGSKRFWYEYTWCAGGFFLIFAVAGWLVTMGMDLIGESQVLRSVGDFAGIAFVFACCGFCGGAFAEKAAGKMGRY